MPKPPLPDDCELPCAINGWLYDIDDTSNGHVWRSSSHDCSVGVFDNLGSIAVRVTDDRVSGYASNIELERVEYDDRDENEPALQTALEFAAEWMRGTDPDAWSHPEVCEAVFDAPAGHTLEDYYLENRETILYYRRDGTDGTPLRGRGDDVEKLTAENAPYLYVHVWNGSGNATVALAPWTNAHGPKSEHQEIKPIVETPAECGLEAAVTIAREWTRENVDALASRQADLENAGPQARSDGGEKR